MCHAYGTYTVGAGARKMNEIRTVVLPIYQMIVPVTAGQYVVIYAAQGWQLATHSLLTHPCGDSMAKVAQSENVCHLLGQGLDCKAELL